MFFNINTFKFPQILIANGPMALTLWPLLFSFVSNLTYSYYLCIINWEVMKLILSPTKHLLCSLITATGPIIATGPPNCQVAALLLLRTHTFNDNELPTYLSTNRKQIIQHTSVWSVSLLYEGCHKVDKKYLCMMWFVKKYLGPSHPFCENSWSAGLV